MEFTSAEGEQRYAALVRAAPDAVVGLDFDGTLAPLESLDGRFGQAGPGSLTTAPVRAG